MKQEVWLRGPLPEIPLLLQPVAHALLQAREEVLEMATRIDEGKLWNRPAGMASAGFHLQHLTGVLDRLFTYAQGKALSEIQLRMLKAEGNADNEISVKSLVENFSQQVDRALEQLRTTDELTLTEIRGVGRANIPATVIGLYVHAAEHSMRHVGQLLVTVAVLNSNGRTQ
ncbi:DinB family protein [Persicitalea jodogahamensis]|uniref:DinB-like domain-containing protein n=1 Tax=Persicitalea jodogahamensis TaxID=402147 RepID=A0A8J3D8F5_9BACT|nr:DinB family protein [Persicitalea jodogahamensis]GHB76028.1 hypothetical protein GCM10007390_32370 [Persicitalea jodogahamensis]